jgi:hypothetical protein
MMARRAILREPVVTKIDDAQGLERLERLHNLETIGIRRCWGHYSNHCIDLVWESGITTDEPGGYNLRKGRSCVAHGPNTNGEI